MGSSGTGGILGSHLYAAASCLSRCIVSVKSSSSEQDLAGLEQLGGSELLSVFQVRTACAYHHFASYSERPVT